MLALLLLPSSFALAQTPPPARDERFGIVHVSYASELRGVDRYGPAASAGARWNRWALYWTDVELSPGVYDWSGPDATIAADQQYGFRTDAILLGTPGFYNTGLGAAADEPPPRVGDKSAALAFLRGQPLRRSAAAAIAPPRGLYLPTFADGTDGYAPGKAINQSNVWARFVAAAVARYKGRVALWEIWNEPDFSQFWSGSLPDYVRLLKVAWLAARSVDPSAQIFVGGMMHWEWANRTGVEHAWLWAFLDELARDSGAAQNGYYFDGIPWHWYSRPSDAYDKTRSALAILQSRGITGKTMWVNESNAPACGEPPRWVSCADPNYRGSATLEEQAAYVIQFFAYALAGGVDRSFMFQFQDDGNAESFGLFRNDLTARPAYTAYQVAVAHMGLATAATREGAGNVERITIPTLRGRTTVVWARGPSGEIAQIPTLTSTATLVEPDGTTASVQAVNGVYTVPLAGATNNKGFSNNPNDYPIGGRPRLVVESFVPQPVPPPPPGWQRQYYPLGPQRTGLG
ncbi:MAG TPA: hypothetical protein VGM69_14270 [Chloroflexota bacterium]